VIRENCLEDTFPSYKHPKGEEGGWMGRYNVCYNSFIASIKNLAVGDRKDAVLRESVHVPCELVILHYPRKHSESTLAALNSS